MYSRVYIGSHILNRYAVICKKYHFKLKYLLLIESLFRQLLPTVVFILVFIYDIIQFGDVYDKFKKRLEITT